LSIIVNVFLDEPVAKLSDSPERRVAGYQLPVTSYQLPGNTTKEDVTGYRFQVAEKANTVAGYQVPVARKYNSQ
jgi:hypothetical protein